MTRPPTRQVRKRAYYLGAGTPRALVREYFRRLGSVSLVLDLGCGVGSVAQASPPCARVIGADHDRGALQLAAKHGAALVWDASPGWRTPFPSNIFDAVIARDVLEHLDRPWDAVHEIHEVLKPGGLALASVPMARPRVVWNDYTHRRGFTRAAVRLLFLDAGFEVERVERMGPLPLLARLGLMRAAPWLLRVPLLDQCWGTSWEVLARKT